VAVNFSVIAQTGQVRAITQNNLLQRVFHDALLPAFLFRMDVEDERWEAQTGDTKIFTGKGLIQPNMRPIAPGSDISPKTYNFEQWTATANQYADGIETTMPASIVAIANLFLDNAKQIGIQAGQSMNRKVRDVAYDAALSGNSMCNGSQSSVTTLAVCFINGFTTARRPDLTNGSPVLYAPVSANNPLPITIYSSTGPTVYQRTVVGFTGEIDPATGAMDTVGPGTLTLSGGAVTVVDRDAVLSNDCSVVIRAGGGNSSDTVLSGAQFTLAMIRSAVAQLRTQNVQTHGDRYYHAHFDPVTESQIFNDSEWQRLNTALPDYYPYKELAIGQSQGTIFLRNNECPQQNTVTTVSGEPLYSPLSYSPADPFGGFLQTQVSGPAVGTNIHRALFSGLGGIKEYWVPLDQLITEVGLNGKVGEASVTNDGIEVFTDRIQLIFRAPIDRLQQTLSTAWTFIGDWPVRTDGLTGNSARYKRVLATESGE
jgi:hypothetical protein